MSSTPTDYPATVGACVRAELARQQKTQAQMADVLKVTAGTAARRLSGEVPFDVRELVQLSTWLGVGLRQLVPDADDRSAATA